MNAIGFGAPKRRDLVTTLDREDNGIKAGVRFVAILGGVRGTNAGGKIRSVRAAATRQQERERCGEEKADERTAMHCRNGSGV